MSAPSPRHVLSTYIYTAEAILRTIEIFDAYCTVDQIDLSGEIWVTVSPYPDAPSTVTDEFLNYALNLSVEHALTEA